MLIDVKLHRSNVLWAYIKLLDIADDKKFSTSRCREGICYDKSLHSKLMRFVKMQECMRIGLHAGRNCNAVCFVSSLACLSKIDFMEAWNWYVINLCRKFMCVQLLHWGAFCVVFSQKYLGTSKICCIQICQDVNFRHRYSSKCHYHDG